MAVLLGQVILISAQVTTPSGTKVLHAVTFGLFSQVQIGTARLFGGVRGIWDGYFALRGLHRENRRLEDELMAVRVRLQEQQALALRGAQLEALLELKGRTQLKTIAASVIAGDATNGVLQRVTIDRGSEDGLRKDMAVLGAGGIVGRVVETSLNAAKVQLLIEREAGAGALVERSSAGGVVSGHDNEGELPLRMDFVSNLADVKMGDRVVTSGLDGIFPRGFPIGDVARVEPGLGLYKRIWLKPTVEYRRAGQRAHRARADATGHAGDRGQAVKVALVVVSIVVALALQTSVFPFLLTNGGRIRPRTRGRRVGGSAVRTGRRAPDRRGGGTGAGCAVGWHHWGERILQDAGRLHGGYGRIAVHRHQHPAAAGRARRGCPLQRVLLHGAARGDPAALGHALAAGLGAGGGHGHRRNRPDADGPGGSRLLEAPPAPARLLT